MQKTIPTHLISSYQLLLCAFPQGIDEQLYFPLLSILHQEMSDRNLAEVIAEFTGREYHSVLNDIYQVSSTSFFVSELIEAVQTKLSTCNYAEWLAAE